MGVRSRLIVFTGLPGTGKSTLADEAAAILGCPLFAKDQLEAALRRSGIGADANSGWAAVELLTMLAAEQLRRGQSAILDTVATFERMRVPWRALAGKHHAHLRIIECICSDAALHRALALRTVVGPAPHSRRDTTPDGESHGPPRVPAGRGMRRGYPARRRVAVSQRCPCYTPGSGAGRPVSAFLTSDRGSMRAAQGHNSHARNAVGDRDAVARPASVRDRSAGIGRGGLPVPLRQG